MMLDTETFGYAIARPFAEVYEFLLDPKNYSKWASSLELPMRHLGGRDWAAETTVGSRIVRFPERNDFGVLDYGLMVAAGDPVHPAGLWAIASGAGTQLVYTNFRWPGMTDAAWASAKSWITADYLGLQSLLENRGKLTPTTPARLATFSIHKPLRDVYEFLLRPENFARWAFVGDTKMTSLGDGDWAVETSVGPRILRFADRNRDFVLTHSARNLPTDTPSIIPMRLMANGDGTELIYVFMPRPALSEAEWVSMIEWVTADLGALTSYLENEL
jgi:uncharacterized protein YndB with AHSA1/START domain